MARLENEGADCLAMLSRHFARMADGSVSFSTPREPGDVAKQIAINPPAEATPMTTLLKDVEEVIFPGLTHWQHPRFMAYYPGNTSLPAILSETLCAGAAVVGLQWASSPSCTELEVRVMDWLADMIGLDPDSPFRHTSGKGGGLIQNTAGEAILNVFVCAKTHVFCE